MGAENDEDESRYQLVYAKDSRPEDEKEKREEVRSLEMNILLN